MRLRAGPGREGWACCAWGPLAGEGEHRTGWGRRRGWELQRDRASPMEGTVCAFAGSQGDRMQPGQEPRAVCQEGVEPVPGSARPGARGETEGWERPGGYWERGQAENLASGREDMGKPHSLLFSAMNVIAPTLPHPTRPRFSLTYIPSPLLSPSGQDSASGRHFLSTLTAC